MRRPRKSKLLWRRTRPSGGVKTDEAAQEQAPVEVDQTSGVKTDEAAQELAPVEEVDQTSGIKTDEAAQEQAPVEEDQISESRMTRR